MNKIIIIDKSLQDLVKDDPVNENDLDKIW